MSPEYISLVANLFTAPLHIEASALLTESGRESGHFGYERTLKGGKKLSGGDASINEARVRKWVRRCFPGLVTHILTILKLVVLCPHDRERKRDLKLGLRADAQGRKKTLRRRCKYKCGQI